MTIDIRLPNLHDSAALAALLGELGYPASPDELPARLEAFAEQANAAIWVAEVDGELAGLASGHTLTSVHKSDPVAMLTVLVVSAKHRSRGVGRALVAHVESWARAQGASTISLTSAVRRTDAHAFYASLGYEQTGVRLARPL